SRRHAAHDRHIRELSGSGARRRVALDGYCPFRTANRAFDPFALRFALSDHVFGMYGATPREGFSIPHLQRLDKRLLGDLHLAELAHALLAFLLLLKELALAGDVAAVALGRHVLPERPDSLARDDA